MTADPIRGRRPSDDCIRRPPDRPGLGPTTQIDRVRREVVTSVLRPGSSRPARAGTQRARRRACGGEGGKQHATWSIGAARATREAGSAPSADPQSRTNISATVASQDRPRGTHAEDRQSARLRPPARPGSPTVARRRSASGGTPIVRGVANPDPSAVELLQNGIAPRVARASAAAPRRRRTRPERLRRLSQVCERPEPDRAPHPDADRHVADDLHPIFRYPGRLFSFGVLKTKSASRRRASSASRVSREKIPRPW